jgi:protein-arginine kinase activator protein McsA
MAQSKPVPLYICITCSAENYSRSSDDQINTEYETESELQQHKLLAHGQAASWRCPYCQQCFKNNYNLRRHMNSSCKSIKNLILRPDL